MEREQPFVMPLANPAFPPGPYRFLNREWRWVAQWRPSCRTAAARAISGARIKTRRVASFRAGGKGSHLCLGFGRAT
jgi:hypothetical protein